MKKPKAIVNKELQVRPDAELWNGSRILLEKAQADQKGSYYLFMSSILFAAFSLEAYLNHIGCLIFDGEAWKEFEVKPPLHKLDALCTELNVSQDKSKRPYQTIKSLFSFRNRMVHGYTTNLEISETRPVDDYLDKHLGEQLKADWQKYCTESNAIRARDDVLKIASEIHANGLNFQPDKIKEPDYPFIFGTGLHTAHLLE